jgi:hypothetical protein
VAGGTRLVTNQTQVVIAKASGPVPLPKPGVYTSAPYTCVVIVPDGHIDEKFVIGGAGPTIPDMPTIVPHLELIPRKTAKP